MPSEVNLIATRYVRALFDIATEQKQHDNVKKDMLAVRAMLEGSAELQKLLINPLMSRMNAEKAIGVILKAMKACDLTSKFLITLARQRRLAVLPVAIEKYLAELAESRGELTVHVASAKALGAEQLKVLTTALAKATSKKIEVKTEEDPSLIGGVQVRIGSKMLDNTIAAKLARLRLALTKAA